MNYRQGSLIASNAIRRTRFGRGAFAVLLIALSATSAAAEVGDERKAELLHLLRHDCGSCHGMSLKGGLGPALAPENLKGKSPAMLRATILIGRAGTPMPPWRPFLTEEEVDWLVNTLQRGVPDAP